MKLFPETSADVPAPAPQSLVRFAWLFCAVILIASAIVLFRPGAPLEIPVPKDLPKFDPQVRAYLEEKIAFARQEPNDFNRQAELGMAYAANSLWSEARLAFANAARLKPSEPLAALYVAIATQESAGFEKALPLYRDVARKHLKFPQAFYRLGDAAMRSGNYREAEGAFKELVELAPREWRGYAGLAEAQIRQNKFSQGLELLGKALALAPKEKIIHHLRGLALRGLGRLPEAERELAAGLNAQHFPMEDAWSVQAPRHMKLVPDQLELAKDLAKAGQPDKAAAVLEEARRWHPDNPALALKLAEVDLDLGQIKQAQSILEEQLKNRPADCDMLLVYVNSWLDLQQFDRALEFAQKAVAAAGNLPQPHLSKATVLRALNRFHESLEEFTTAASLDPKNPYIQMEIGDLLLRNLNRPLDALAAYQKADQIDPSLILVKIRLADVCIRLGQSEPAARALAAARSLDPNQPVIKVLEQRLEKLANRDQP